MSASRSLRVHTLVAALSVAMAWSAWRDTPQSEAGPSVVGMDPGSITRLSWHQADTTFTLAKPDADADADLSLTLTAATGAPEVWPAAPAAGEVVALLPQLRALRALPPPDANQRVEWGLGDDAATLTLTGRTSGRPTTRTLRVGTGTFGAHDYIVQNEDGAVFLVAQRALSPLTQPATRLQDRDALALPAHQIEAVTLRLGGERRQLALRHERGQQRAYWTDAQGDPGRLDQVDAWLDRLQQVRVVKQLAETPAGPAELEVTVEATDGAGRLGGRRASIAMWPAQEHGIPARVSRFEAPVLLHPFAAGAALSGAADVLHEKPEPQAPTQTPP